MRIKVDRALRPFSHCPGIRTCLPHSTLAVRIYPTRLELYDLRSQEERLLKVIDLEIRGPVEGFTVTQDLERGEVGVHGRATEGYLRYKLLVKGGQALLQLLKAPHTLGVEGASLNPGDQALLFEDDLEPGSDGELLSLGSHKSQDWQLVCRRRDVREILPAWFRLGHLVSAQSAQTKAPSLLSSCQDAIRRKECEKLSNAFLGLFAAGFRDLLFPTLTDRRFQGFDLPPAVAESPLALLTEGARLIRSLFLESEGESLHLLPALPPEAFAGRLLRARVSFGTLDMEWTKKSIRRVILRPTCPATALLSLRRDIRRFRLRRKPKEKGEILDRDQGFDVFENQIIFLDRFER